MDSPVIVEKKPFKVDLEADKTVYWCSCGKSSKQPFCDGSHKDSDFSPVAFTPKESGLVYLCLCKHTKNPPFCDRSHNDL